MAYRGTEASIDCSRGGFTGNPNIDAIPKEMVVWPSRNINLHNNKRQRRGGTSHVYDNPIGSGEQILGLYDFTMRDGTQHIMVANANGDVYADETTKIDSGLSTSTFYSFETGENKLFYADGAAVPRVWDGSGAVGALANPPVDWSTIPCIQLLRHGRGNAQRMWGFNSIGAYASKAYSSSGDLEDFTSAPVFFPIDTPGGYGIIGGIEWKRNLYVFGRQKAYIIDDTDLSTSNWIVDPAPWDGGAASFRLMCVVGDDLICMTDDLEIYSVSVAIQAEDLTAASLTRPAHIDTWLRNNVKVSDISKFHMAFDRALRCLKIWVVKNGYTNADTCLTFYPDRAKQYGAAEAWGPIHDNEAYDSGYKASVSAPIKTSSGYKVYTGDYVGEVWELETANINDNSNAYSSKFTTPNISFDQPDVTKMFNDGLIVSEPEGDLEINITSRIDGIADVADTVSLLGIGGILGSFILGTSVLGESQVIDPSYGIKHVGKRIQTTIYNDSADEDFSVSSLIYRFKPKGIKQS
jgi:hypothetical protein